MSDEPLTREALEIFVHDLTVETNRQIMQATMRRILASDAYLRAQITARDTRIAVMEREVSLDNVLIADRDRVLRAIPCPTHGPCVPHALEWIKARELDESRIVAARLDVARLREAMEMAGERLMETQFMLWSALDGCEARKQ